MDNLDLGLLNSLELRIKKQETVCLESECELTELLNFFNTSISKHSLSEISEVNAFHVLSRFPIPIPEERFEEFYSCWLEATGRDNTMDEYGQLICLNNFVAVNRNSKYMVVLSELT